MKKLLLLITYCLFINLSLNAQTWTWAQKAGGRTSTGGGAAISKDIAGNTYVAGDFQGTESFGSFNLTAAGSVDFFIAKYNSAGTCLWVMSGGGTNASLYGASIATDAQGNSYVTGKINGTANFSGTIVASTGYSDMFVAKYNTAGVLLWAFRKGNAGCYTEASGIAIDQNSNAYVTGFFGATVDFGGTILTATGGQFDKDIFIAKYDADGVMKWAKRAGSSNDDSGNSIVCDALGNPHIAGSFQGTVSFGTINLTASGQTDIFVAKYDTSGNALMAFKSGGNNQEAANAISLDASGNIYITGNFYGNATFGSISLAGDSNYGDMFIAKYNTTGVCQWAKKGGGNNFDMGLGISTDPGGNSYVTGHFYQSALFGTTTLTSNGMQDIFVIKYSNAGNVLWAVKAGGTSDDKGKGIVWDANGFCNVAGYFTNTTSFSGNFLSSSAGVYSIFVARLDGGPAGVNTHIDENKDLEVFPNPAKTEVMLNFKGNPGNAYTLEIIDALGKKIMEESITDFSGVHKQTINTSDLNKGIYFFRVRGEEKTSNRKVVIL